MIGLPISRLIPPGRLRDHERALARIFAGENVASFPSLYSALDGRDVAVSITLSPVLDASGMIVAASAVIRPRSAARSAPSTAPNRSAPGPAPRTDGDPFARRTILVVEDEAIIGLGFAAMLENSGFDVVGPVGDLGQAMALLDAHDCALAILDVSLARGETSEPLARRLRHEGIPFFLVSGAAQKDSRPDFAEARSLTKPVGARRLVATVHEMIG
jgi:CheY-like chemotaxis protein